MKIMAICFYASTKTNLDALKTAGWCDTYYLQSDKIVGGIPGTVEELKKLNINFKQYQATLIFQDTLSPVQEYFNEQCVKNNITVYANQHGFNKSILQIVKFIPNIYSKYWNCMGKYFPDRFEEVMSRSALTQRWISLGSLKHDYLYKNYQWKPKNNNGKALIIHEPDLKICEGDSHPHDSERITNFIIENLKKEGINADMKLHPNWKNFVGNTGKPLDRPKGVNFVDIKLEEIVNYALVIGSRSTVLLDAVAMGIPTMALASSSDWEDDKYPPVEEGLIPNFTQQEFSRGLRKCFNKKPIYDEPFRNYFLGPLGKITDNYYKFIEQDLKNPAKVLGDVYIDWQKELSNYLKKKNSFYEKSLQLSRRLRNRAIGIIRR